jgi:phosphatidylglycerophosphate synthase
MRVIVTADSPNALLELCGVSMIERTLRVLKRLGVSSVSIVDPDTTILTALSKPSWPRSGLRIDFIDNLPDDDQLTLLVPGEIYCDARLLAALLKCSRPTALIDSHPPTEMLPLLPARVPTVVGKGESETLDAAQFDPYIGSMRRTIQPLWFAAPEPQYISLAERWIYDSAQKGTLDIPAIFHGPIETWIAGGICRTRITPNQITFFSTLLGVVATIAFVRGEIWSGALMAAVFGVLDGVDGKLARIKVETTELGKWEHYIDHALEYSWWLALAYSLGKMGLIDYAWIYAALMIGGDLLGKIVTRPVKAHTGKPSHDFGSFERGLRLIGGRRNIYIWMLLLGLIAGFPGPVFAAVCCWSMMTAAIQAARAIYICNFTPRISS